MDNSSYNIVRAEGGFIVYKQEESQSPDVYRSPQPRVFTDSSALLNYLHNELVGSN